MLSEIQTNSHLITPRRLSNIILSKPNFLPKKTLRDESNHLNFYHSLSIIKDDNFQIVSKSSSYCAK